MIRNADDGALVYYLSHEGEKCSITLSALRPELFINYDEPQWSLQLNGEKFVIHNDNGPAILRDIDKAKENQAYGFVWLYKGRLHNANGAAGINAYAAPYDEQNHAYFLHGVEFTHEEFQGIKNERLDCFYTIKGILKFFKAGTRTLHREGGPAVYCSRADKTYQTWYKDGIIHRGDDKPAHTSIDTDGTINQYWFKNGRMHRETGPAISRSNGETEYALHGARMNQEQFLKKVGAIKKDIKIKARGPGVSEQIWKSYLNKAEQAYKQKALGSGSPVDDCKRLLSKFLSRKGEANAAVAFFDVDRAYKALSEEEQNQIQPILQKAAKRLRKTLRDFPQRKAIQFKLRLLEVIGLSDEIITEMKDHTTEIPPDEVLLTTDTTTTTTQHATPTVSEISFAAIAAACLTIAGICGLTAKKKKDVEYKVEV